MHSVMFKVVSVLLECFFISVGIEIAGEGQVSLSH